MIFSELYSAYYNTVAKILSAAVNKPLEKNEIRDIVERNAFAESVLNIEPAVLREKWQLVHSNGATEIKHAPTVPLTVTEKRWLKAIFTDPRIKLFCDDEIDLPDVEPLFNQDDILVFDKYSDGDPYEDSGYIKNFRLVLDAIKNKYAIETVTLNRKGNTIHTVVMPKCLEYSEKDDKFRAICCGNRSTKTINVARIVSCERYDKPFKADFKAEKPNNSNVEFELYDRRKALERVLLHFAHFEKQAERLDGDKYKVTVTYNRDDETEILIRLLSFGPMVKVTAPQYFVELIKDRLMRQCAASNSCSR